MSKAWNTKYGPRRVREEPPTLEEAIAAAKGLTDDLKEQAAFAAALMNIPVEKVPVAVLKAAQKKDVNRVYVRRAGSERAVVVERKVTRRPGTYRPLGGVR